MCMGDASCDIQFTDHLHLLAAAAAAAAPTRLAVGWSYLCLSDWLYAVAVMKFVASVISVWNGYLALSRRRDCCY